MAEQNAPQPQPEPDEIGEPPDADETVDFSPKESRQYLDVIAQLSSELETARATVDELTPARIRAKLMEPYANKVFIFVCVYSVVTLLALVAHGWSLWGFQLPTSILIALVGSTAIAAFGLVKGVVGGLFAHP